MMATIYVDNKPYQVEGGQNLLAACLSIGFDLPYFCWHPALHSAGACRQCAVKQFRDEKDTRGKIVMSCMTPVTDGLRISVDDPDAKAFRAGIIELLMANHPHDCPVCDEGGECHLQDMTVMTGHVSRRYQFKKRTHRNQDLGPFINHEMNRCIQCYRCVRFYRDYAGGRDLEVMGSHHHVYFGRHEDGALESEFSGNLIEVCPTGVFTDKTLKRHYTRKWDLQTAPSVCVHCSLGCNIFPGERYGMLRRILNRYNSEVNGYFLCDRGRFGYEFVNDSRRVRTPLLKSALVKNALSKDDESAGWQKGVTVKDVLGHIGGLLHFGADVIGIGSPRASLEANFLLRELVGPEHFYAGISSVDFLLVPEMLSILQNGPTAPASLREVREADVVFILGEDLTNTAPMLALAVRQSVRTGPMAIADRLMVPAWHDAAVRTAAQNEVPLLFIAAVESTRLDDAAGLVYRGAPDDIARLGFAVAAELSSSATEVTGMSEDMRVYVKTIADALRMALRPVVISGGCCGSVSVIRAAANVSVALCEKGHRASLCFSLPECNSMGLALMGPKSLDEAINASGRGGPDTLLILENDLFRRADRERIRGFFDAAKNILVLDHTRTATVEQADIVLPAATYAEATGTIVNNEGRCQRSYAVFPPAGEIQPSSKWLHEIIVASGRTGSADTGNIDGIMAAMASAIPALRAIGDAGFNTGFWAGSPIKGMKIPRQPHRYSGRTAMNADKNVHEPRPPDDPDSALSFSMEGYEGRTPDALAPRAWAPKWNSVQAVNMTAKDTNDISGVGSGGKGIRLVEPGSGMPVSFFMDIPEAFIPRSNELLIVRRSHIFGSEELSALSPAVAERRPMLYLALNNIDAEKLGIAEGGQAEVQFGRLIFRLPVVLSTALPMGIGGLPLGLPGLEWAALPEWATVRKSGERA
ncbi:MAG: NADH-quinone oxidoreductase subunit NuoG [Thermodesulfovibrionales bacterium]